MATVHDDPVAKIRVLVAVEKAKVDFPRICLGNALDQGTLLDAIAAPDAADDQYIHLPNEPSDKFALRGTKGGCFVSAPPALLLFLFARS